MTQTVVLNESVPENVEVVAAGPQGPQGPQGPKGDVGDVNPQMNTILADAQSARNAAQSARDQAVSAQAGAETAKTSAESAQSAAITARIAAETAQTGAQNARTGAETAQASASASATTATTKAAEAVTSASNASSSASSAAMSASTATTKASEVAAGVNSANDYAASALASRNAAASSATSAASSASTASTKATDAANSATAAANSATSAASSAATATSQASLIGTAVTQASNSASAAATSASQAAISASNAASSVTTVQAAATDAQASKVAAQAAAADAQGYRDTAVSGASLATTKANDAAASALAASGSVTSASNAAATATTKASEAAASAAQAAASAVDAAASVASLTADVADAQIAAAAAENSAEEAATYAQTIIDTYDAAGDLVSSAAVATAAANQAAQSALIASQYSVASGLDTATRNAQAAASLAQGFAASASSVVQQDLSGATAQALHRSPNAITSMFIYDTSKDSDGGAWTEKCQHTSWWNEPLMGKWLGAHASETNARYEGATLGSELVTNGTFDSDTAWTKGTGWTISAGKAVGSGSIGTVLQQNVGAVVGKTYRISFTVVATNLSIDIVAVGGASINSTFSTGTHTIYLTAITTGNLQFRGWGGGAGFTGTIDNVSVREVIALTTVSGDYFQLTTDGKFYRLWKNLLQRTEQFTNGYWGKNASITVTDNAGYSTVSVPNTVPASTNIIFKQSITTLPVVSYRLEVRGPVGTSIRLQGDHGGSTIAFSGDWQTITFTSTGNGAFQQFYIQTVANLQAYSFDIRYPQMEAGAASTSYEAKVADGTITETFRGNKADFPRLAAIVGEASSLTIYDLTEPGRPMWMRFIGVTNAGTALGYSIGTRALAGVFALQGRMLVCGNTGGGQAAFIDFAGDRVEKLSNAAYGAWFVEFRPLSQRNDATTAFFSSNIASLGAPSLDVNAVTATVLPDAPVDLNTGLKVPTIAAATNGGVSILKHNRTMVNSSLTNSYNHIYIDKNILMFSRTGSRGVYYATNPGALGSSFNVSLMGGDPDQYQAQNPTVEHFSSRAAPMRFAAPSVYRKLNHEALPARGLNMAVASNFNTGWLPGDIRRAYLSDTEAGTYAPGGELVVNGKFDADVLGWTHTSGIATWQSSGRLRQTDDGVNRGASSSQTFTTTIGRIYRVAGTMVNRSNTGTTPYVRISSSTGAVLYVQAHTSGFSFTFVATTATTTISLYFDTSVGSNWVEWDDISVTEPVLDRSYKAAVAYGYGTLTRAQLATGTSLVGYSGFSAANYIREPYSADLDFGTGEWSCSAWVNVPDTANLGGNLLRNDTIGALTGSSRITATGPTGASEFVGQFGDGTSSFASYFAIPFIQGAVAGRRTTISLWVKIVSDTSGQNGSVDFYHYAGTINAIPFSAASQGVGNWFQLSRTGVNSGNDNQLRLAIPAGMVVQVTRLLLQHGSTVGSFVDSGASQAITQNMVASRAAASGASLKLFMDSLGRLAAEVYDGTTTRTVTTSTAYNTATWLKAEACYTTDGTLSIRVNGREVAATRGTPLLTLNNSSAVLTIGNSFAADAPFPGSIALLKLSATVPTYEQSQFMYEQEKQLFRAGAQSVLPDSGSIVDMAYDDATDRWVAISATNESYWTGLVRNSVTPVPAGSFTRVVAGSGVELAARSTTNPGVDVTIPAYGLREELVKRAEAAARLTKELVTYDYVGGFTANTTTGNTAITNVSTITYPASYIGARISGSGIPANTTIVAVSGTTIYLSAAATATATGVSISFLDFELPVGMEAKTVISAGAIRVEGATKDFTRLYDGFIETIRFGVAPGATAAVQIQAQRITLQ